MTHFAQRLDDAVQSKSAPVCVGLDPVFQRLPVDLQTTGDEVEAIRGFCDGVLEAVAPHVPAVKIQAACFERYRTVGVEAMFALLEQAKELGLVVILDAKRGDIGTSSAHYAAGLLDGPADALTVNSYLGMDGIEPFADLAAREGKGLFALVRTSNPGGDALQSLELKGGRSVSDAVADLVAEFGRSKPEYLSPAGESLLGAVVGATKSADAARLRERMPEQIFLVPGFGAQGGSAEDVRACFREDGSGALVTASRSVLYAFQNDPDADWRQAVAGAARDLSRQIAGILG
ncbi:MAG: orotidine-5'-phosphate decarboxylase [Phycisphaeraceae bacterium]